MSQGTQIKIVLDLPDGFQGLVKPYRFFFRWYFDVFAGIFYV